MQLSSRQRLHLLEILLYGLTLEIIDHRRVFFVVIFKIPYLLTDFCTASVLSVAQR